MRDDNDELLTPGEVAAMFQVTPKTVSTWARAGKLRAIRTLGGHRRFYRSDIEHAALVSDLRDGH